jgi:hypothetical protein
MTNNIKQNTKTIRCGYSKCEQPDNQVVVSNDYNDPAYCSFRCAILARQENIQLKTGSEPEISGK